MPNSGAEMRNLLLTVLFVWLPAGSAAEIGVGSTPWDEPSVHISGLISKGDFEEFRAIARTLVNDGDEVQITLNSPGGDFLEAIRIGTLIKNLNARTIAHGIISTDPNEEPKRCYSACFLILVAGGIRDPEDNEWIGSSAATSKQLPVLGIHRPYVDSQTFSSLTATEARELYSRIETATRSYLASLDVPSDLVDEMFKVSSADIRLLSRSEFKERIGYTRPFLDEWFRAKCGALSSSEIADLGDVNAERIMSKNPDAIPEGVSRGYVDYLVNKSEEIEKCMKRAILAHQKLTLGDR